MKIGGARIRAQRGRLPKGNGSAPAASAARHVGRGACSTVKQAPGAAAGPRLRGRTQGACANDRMTQAGARPSIAMTAAMLASAAAFAAAPAHAPASSGHAGAPARAASAAPAAPAASVATATLSDACPAQLPVRQTVLGAVDGWTPLDQQGNHPFVRVAFYPGPPAQSTLIVPTVEYKGLTGLHDGWDLPRRPGGYWMTCAYGNTTASVARKLADDVDFCQANYDGRFLTLVVRHWSCGVKRLMPPPVWARAAARQGSKAPARPPIKRGD